MFEWTFAMHMRGVLPAARSAVIVALKAAKFDCSSSEGDTNLMGGGGRGGGGGWWVGWREVKVQWWQ